MASPHHSTNSIHCQMHVNNFSDVQYNRSAHFGAWIFSPSMKSSKNSSVFVRRTHTRTHTPSAVTCTANHHKSAKCLLHFSSNVVATKICLFSWSRNENYFVTETETIERKTEIILCVLCPVLTPHTPRTHNRLGVGWFHAHIRQCSPYTLVR